MQSFQKYFQNAVFKKKNYGPLKRGKQKNATTT